MSRIRFLRSLLVSGSVCAVLVCAATVQAQQYDTSQSYDQSQGYDNADQAPGRVARLAYLSGQVQFAPAGENDWGSVEINRPMVIGDRLLTGDDGRAVLELGDASVRIDNDSAFDFLNLDANNVQIELSQGTLNLAVRQMGDGENFEVDTPTVAFVAATPGVYRIDDDPSGTGSMVTVFRGSGTVYGENGASRQVVEGTSYRFNDSALASVDVNGLPQPDDFDRFCEARDASYQNYAQQEQQYVPPDMIGGDDLYQYGQWNAVPEYGNVWYPTTVPVGWAPYRYGHWAWIDPWGWTWVDNQPWGFAPFHYGRWVYISNRWGWMPGPVNLRPVYAPALVAFIGGSGFSLSINLSGGGPVGWFPLGPSDVYVPWFPVSRNYFTNVNVTNIRNVYVNKTVINNFYGDYRAGRVPPRGGHDYAYRNLPDAVTAVPRNVFTDARPVSPAVLRLNRNQLARTEVAVRPGVNPGTASLGLRRPTTRPLAIRDGEPFARPVVARHQPPPRPVEFAAREKVIASQHGQPLTPVQMQDLRKTRPATGPRDERVRLVPALAAGAAGAAAFDALRHGATPPRPTEQPTRSAPPRPGVVQRTAEPPARRVTSGGPPFQNTVHPIPARNQPELRPGELPSARFARPDESRSLPQPAVIRPANEPQAGAPPGRLPVVRPLERASQADVERTDQRQRQADLQAQQRGREQQSQQQRQLQEQSQQRMRTQQADQQQMQQQMQQRQAQMQAEQEARAQQMQQQRQMQEQAQQQRQMQMQDEQRARKQQMQQMRQQREVQMQQMRMQPAQRPVERPAPRAAPERREPPPPKHPPESSGN